MIHFNEIHAFTKEFKKLKKKYRSLPKDLELFKKVLTEFPEGNSRHFAVLHQEESLQIFKTRMFCRYLRGNTLRVIYSYYEGSQKIEFIEIYFKGDKEREDSVRIKGYCKANCR